MADAGDVSVDDRQVLCGEVVMLSDTSSACGVTGCGGVVHPLHGILCLSPLSIPALMQLAVEQVAAQVAAIMKDDCYCTDTTHASVGTWLGKVTDPRVVDAVIWRVQEIRTPWLPIDLHWVETEPDPLLLMLAHLTRLQTLTYSVVPQALPPLQALLVGLPNLSTLQLRHTADDALLRTVGRYCPNLRVLCLQGSRSVSDSGLRRLLLRPVASSRCAWRDLYRRWREVRKLPAPPNITSGTCSPGGGGGAGSSQQQYQYHLLLPLPPVPSAHQLTELAGVLVHLDLRGTRVTLRGARWGSQCLPRAHLLILAPSCYAGSRNKRYHSLEEQHHDCSSLSIRNRLTSSS